MPFFLATMAVGIAVGTAGKLQEGKARKSAEKVQAAGQRIQAQKERTRQIRESRKQRAAILQAGESQGVSGSSSVVSGAAGATSQAFQNIGIINDDEARGLAASNARQSIINAQGVQTLGEGITAFGAMGMNNKAEVQDIFGIG